MKGAQAKKRRPITARELAARLGSSERAARQLVAEAREEFLARSKGRRDRAVELRQQALKYREISEAMGITVGAVSGLLREAKKNGELDGDEPHPDEPAEPGALSEQD